MGLVDVNSFKETNKQMKKREERVKGRNLRKDGTTRNNVN